MKKILYITAFVPEQGSAGEKFSKQLLELLSASAKVDLVYFKYSHNNNFYTASRNLEVVKIFRNSLLIKIINILLYPFVFPLFSARFNILRLLSLKKIVRQGNYDTLVFDFSQTFLFASFFKSANKVLISHDIIAQRYSRIYGGILTPIVKFSERRLLATPGSEVFCLSEKDSILAKDYYKLETNFTAILMDRAIMDAWPESTGDYYIFFGNWARKDNYSGLHWFLDKVYPVLERKFTARVIGPGLPGHLRKLIAGTESIEYRGFVEDPYPEIANAKALISPLFSGAGIKVKALEALACGTEIIGTSVSLEGIPGRFADFMTLADNADSFKGIIESFKTDTGKKKELKSLFLANYPDKKIAEHILNNRKH